MDESIKILKNFSSNMRKALTGAVVSSITKRAKLSRTDTRQFIDTSDDLGVVRVVGSNGSYREYETPIIPSEVIEVQELATPIQKSDSTSTCNICRYMYKSELSSCPRCDFLQIKEVAASWVKE